MEGKKEGKVDKTEGKEGSYIEGEEEEERTLIRVFLSKGKEG